MDEYGLINAQENLFEAIANLDFVIPTEIFLAFDSLTNFVGYVMPLRLYFPIIALILSYWFILICAKSLSMVINSISGLASLFAKFFV